MKKTVALILLLSIALLCACGDAPAAETTAQPTPELTAEPTPVAEPETEEAEVIALKAPAIIARLERGDIVELMGVDFKYMDYYIVKSDKGYGLLNKQFMRTEGQRQYESWMGYASSDTVMYTDYTMKTVETDEFNSGDELTVLEKLDTCYVVSFGDKIGVIPLDSVKTTNRLNWDVDYSGGDGGGYSGGGSGGWDGVPQDGGDIVISGFMGTPAPKLEKLATVIEQEDGKISGKAEVVVSGAPLIAAVYERGEKVRVLEWGEETTELYIIGFNAQTETRFLRDKNADEFDTWICYTKQGAKLYKDIAMKTTDFTPLNRNTEFTVIADMGDCWLVESEKETGYIDKSEISDKKITVDFSGYSGGDSSSSSGGSSDWTAPVY